MAAFDTNIQCLDWADKVRLYANFPAELAISGDIPRMNGDTALYVLKLKFKVYTKVTLHPRKRISQGWTNHEKSISWRFNADLKPCFEGRSHAEYVIILPAQQTTGLCTQPLGCPSSKSPHASPVSCSSWYKPRQCHGQSRAHDANRTSWSHFDAGKTYVLGECCCTVISRQVSPNWRGRRMKSDLDCLRQCLSPWRFISAWQTDTRHTLWATTEAN
jgi:hypothetical protein